MTQTSPQQQLTRGYLIALISAAILSTTAIFIRYLYQTYQVPALVLAFWRDVFVCLSLLPALWLINRSLLRLERRHWGYFLIYGLILASFNALWTLSVALNGAAVATVLIYCSPAFTALLARWLLKESLGFAKLLAIGLCLIGCVLVSEALDPAAWQMNLVGILTGVFSGLSYAAYSLMGRSAAQRGLNPWTSLFYAFGFATLILLLVNLLPGGFLPGKALQASDLLWLGQAWTGWVILVVLAAGPTLIGFGLYNVSLSLLPSSIANLILTLEPVFTGLSAYLLLGETLKAIQIWGSLLILGGVVFLRAYAAWHLRYRHARRGQLDSPDPTKV